MVMYRGDFVMVTIGVSARNVQEQAYQEQAYQEQAYEEQAYSDIAKLIQRMTAYLHTDEPYNEFLELITEQQGGNDDVELTTIYMIQYVLMVYFIVNLLEQRKQLLPSRLLICQLMGMRDKKLLPTISKWLDFYVSLIARSNEILQCLVKLPIQIQQDILRRREIQVYATNELETIDEDIVVPYLAKYLKYYRSFRKNKQINDAQVVMEKVIEILVLHRQRYEVTTPKSMLLQSVIERFREPRTSLLDALCLLRKVELMGAEIRTDNLFQKAEALWYELLKAPRPPATTVILAAKLKQGIFRLCLNNSEWQRLQSQVRHGKLGYPLFFFG